ncbi:hypothetical protein CDD81_2025 [Ophiocordyceps australis]|uniref:AB hydrolase-1 domain-containing protein n=1 Tax=Ophiocordyceps australis TaxID=1399860 RepID=A0A2C5YDN3_9HYPO|nr:hypothetical protein CDD81_2025 [Ophiocordyceps australis]
MAWTPPPRCYTSASTCSGPHDTNSCLGKTLKLSDGRILGYHTYGAPHGVPVLYLHGVVDTGVTLEGKEDALGKEMGIRWIAPDRPGVGKSSFHHGRTILGYTDDIRQLVQHLDLKGYYILGVSGGSAYTLACAKVLPRQQVRGVGIGVGVAPWHAGRKGQTLKTLLQMYMMKYWPARLLKDTQDTYVPLARDADPAPMENRFRQNMLPYMDAVEADKWIKTDPIQSSVRVYRQYYAHGIDAHVDDMRLLTRPWGFRIEEVGYEGVKLWYGSADTNTPADMGLYLARRLPKSIYKEYAGETHSSLLTSGHFRGILSDLISDAQ